MQIWNNQDKSEWLVGEWLEEPDKAQWIDEDSNLDCLILRGPVGALCGYVGVPKGHPYFGKGYGEVDITVHGDLTFAGPCRPSEKGEAHGICHATERAANAEVWWFGFDCAHCFDLAPNMYPPEVRKALGETIEVAEKLHRELNPVYRNFQYVQEECKKAAAQFAKVEKYITIEA